MNHTASTQRIVARHRPEHDETDRCCVACGRPWPCDVELLARDLAVNPPFASVPTPTDPIVRASPAHADWFGLAGTRLG